ncbi:MAG: hypothetical protein IJV83_03800 [Clostridia bacterium]|nr:hypothetical protein [Clostridia bacterium]
MLLSELVRSPIRAGENYRGICLGVGISLKNYSIKYLLCATQADGKPDFAVKFSAISSIQNGIRLSALRPVQPNACVKIFFDLPVYTHDGIYLGVIADGELQGYSLTRFITDRKIEFSPADIACARDALLLRKKQAFPLGQRIPAPLLSLFKSRDNIVTKSVLKQAAQQGELIKLTLSLPPFQK